jgi:hypothetical protein
MKLAKLLDPATFNKLCNAVQLNPLTVSQPRVHQVAKGAMHLSLLGALHLWQLGEPLVVKR